MFAELRFHGLLASDWNRIEKRLHTCSKKTLRLYLCFITVQPQELYCKDVFEIEEWKKNELETGDGLIRFVMGHCFSSGHGRKL